MNLRYLIFFVLLIFSSRIDAKVSNNSNSQDTKEEQASNDKSKEDDKKEDDKKDDDKKDDDKKSDDKKEEVEPPRIGIFAFPSSQQPGALVGFGGNIIEKGEVQIYFFADYLWGPHKITTDLIPSVLFGITDGLSIYFNFPFTPILKDGKHRSSGLEDFFVQLEYAFFNYKTPDYEDQATVVLNVTVPTGSATRNPPTGFGAPSFFIGGTYYHVYIDWYFFTNQGAILTTSNHGTKIGDQFLYQLGFGRTICSPEGWLWAWMLEVDGQYNRKNRIRGEVDPNSGGNFIFVTPSIWISNKEMLLQFGVGFPINQNYFGKQNKLDYSINFNFAWSFYTAEDNCFN